MYPDMYPKTELKGKIKRIHTRAKRISIETADVVCLPASDYDELLYLAMEQAIANEIKQEKPVIAINEFQNEEYLTSEQTAKLLKLKASTLCTWRVIGRGPRFTKVGRKVVYKRHDINDWVGNSYSNTGQY